MTRSAAVLAVVVGLLAWTAPAAAETLLFIDSSQRDEWVAQGIVHTITSPQGAFVATSVPGPGGRTVISVDEGRGAWELEFAPPRTRPLEPGVYENATGEADRGVFRPVLDVSSPGRPCSALAGRFVVHEIVRGPGSALLRFAADFEQVCGGVGVLRGSIRIRSGDGACAGVDDGSPCDDGSACTSDETCANGRCVGAVPPCDDADACTALDQCDPRDGECRGGERFDCADSDPCDGVEVCDAATGRCVTGAPVSCGDGDACNGDERCSTFDGTCLAGEPPACDDRSICTADACDPPAGCTHAALGGCWFLEGQTRVRACLDGRCASERASTSRISTT